LRSKDYPAIGERVYTETLENGLRVLVVPKPGYKKAFALFATDYGGADRRFRLAGEWRDTPAGVAHFLEHKMFDMKDGRDALSVLSENGASPNAFTSSDMTAYHFSSTDGFWDNLDTLLRFVSEPYFTEKSVEKEQGIIGQEIRMTEDEPDSVQYYGLLKLLYAENPIRDSVAGTVESIAEITTQTLYDCHKVFYNPSNMVLCVAGDVEPERVAEAAARLLPTRYGEKPERDYGNDKGLRPFKKRTSVTMPVGLPMFLAGVRAPKAEGEALLRQSVTAELALKVLMGASSPLYLSLYEKGLVNAGFSAEFDNAAGVSHCLFGGETASPDAVLDAIREELSRVAASGCDEKLLERVKRASLGASLRGLDSLEAICVGMARGVFRGYDAFAEIPLAALTSADEVNAFIAESLRPENMAVHMIEKGA